MGIGLVVIVPKEDVEKAKKVDPGLFEVGEVVASGEKVVTFV
jgi:phosphoribosylaminoimidazole (AIR) synthetase